MVRETAGRAAAIAGAEAPIVVCNDAHRFTVVEQLREGGIAPAHIILEPAGRGSAPAAALAALIAGRVGGDPVLAVLPADHAISDGDAFAAAIGRAAALAADGDHLVALGVPPTHASTQYGYIRRSSKPAFPPDGFAIERFVEKPDAATAQTFLDDGHYAWNSGIFVFSANTYLLELQRWRPEILSACERAVDRGTQDIDFLRLDREAFEACPPDSIDYAVMENTDKGLTVPVEMVWSDAGSWRALWEVGQKDDKGNVATGDVLLRDAHDMLVRADSRLVVAAGVEGLTIVETRDAVLVSKGEADIKAVVEELGRRGRTEHLAHPRQDRPWGYFEVIQAGKGFQVKELVVNPGGALSLQRHQHRAEHWVVVAGTATVTHGEDKLTLAENQSVYIPAGTNHRLANNRAEPLTIIEIQTGDYLGEDDIIRLDDNYGHS
jgi:mannose-1-phosphate guanylyltransferase/mannose-6-phosphate isomerase